MKGSDDWLQSLKEGDEVCYTTRWHGHIVTKVKKITPSGMIRTEDNRTFRNGYCKFDRWEGTWLEEVTDKIKDRILKKNLVYKLSDTKWTNVPLEKLQKINEILQE